jgi:4-hydroxy-tetrahydrodipicolinate reductase
MKIGILGAKGRMGQMIAAEIRAMPSSATPGAEVDVGGDREAAFMSCDVLIDFTAPAATAEHAALARKYKKPLVIGTTGLGAAEQAALKSAAAETAIFYSANMSVGASLLLSLVEQAAGRLAPEFDIEIFEAHHKNKVDAPSGTALALGHAAAKGRGVRFEDVMVPARHGHTGARVQGSIGMSVFRGGDVVGEHTVTFAGLGERVELAHKATDRAIFARGAVKAALWLKGKPAGLYSMRDMLEI